MSKFILHVLFTLSSSSLINISSDIHASPDIEASLIAAVAHGKSRFESFVSNCLTEGKHKSFYDPLPKLKTFGDAHTIKYNGKRLLYSLMQVFNYVMFLHGINKY